MASLTQIAQQGISSCINEGDRVIDATIGNGHDTLFLAQQVGRNGTVYGFDVQPQALSNTAERLKQHQCNRQVQLFLDSHANLSAHLETELHHQIKAIMFNLGYLPGSDKQCMTQTDSTLKALTLALQYLHPEGVLSIIVYPGHAGGDVEARAVMHWLTSLDSRYQQQIESTPGPVWIKISQN